MSVAVAVCSGLIKSIRMFCIAITGWWRSNMKPIKVSNKNIDEILKDLGETLQRKRPINIARCSSCKHLRTYYDVVPGNKVVCLQCIVAEGRGTITKPLTE